MATFSRHAVLEWSGDVMRGTGSVTAGTDAFSIPATWPRISREAPGHTTPEEMLAASHAICYGIGLRSMIAQRGGAARHIRVQATITADKGSNGIRILSSHLEGVVEGLEGVPLEQLPEIAKATEEACTISIALRGSVAISSEISVVPFKHDG